MLTMLDSGTSNDSHIHSAGAELKHHDTQITSSSLPIQLISRMADQNQDESLLFGRRNDSESSPASESIVDDSPVPDTDKLSDTENTNDIDVRFIDGTTSSSCSANGLSAFETLTTTSSSCSANGLSPLETLTDNQECHINTTNTDIISKHGYTTMLQDEDVHIEITEEIPSTSSGLLPANNAVHHHENAQKKTQIIERTVRRGNRIKKVKIRFDENPEVIKLRQLVIQRRKTNKENRKTKRRIAKDIDMSFTKPDEKRDGPKLSPDHTTFNVPEVVSAFTSVTHVAMESSDGHMFPDVIEKEHSLSTDVGNKTPKKRKIKDVISGENQDTLKKKRKQKDSKRAERKREQFKLLREAKLTKKKERLRRERVKERQKELDDRYLGIKNEANETLEQDGEVTENLIEGTISEEKPPVHAIPVLKRYVLDEHIDTKEVLVELDPILLAKLKPHQVEAVRFMYDCCIESIDQLDKGQDGGGCILAHCMGLGKTLSVISFVHTLMSNMDVTRMRSCLIVCPLNTVKNWVNEFQKWLSDLTFKIEVYELSNIKESAKRGVLLKQWHAKGGVMILGYEMYRNLVQVGKGKVRVQKETYTEILANPGPDLVICDEGHILKNEKSLSYKAMNRIRTRRRVILTGTPLQNNLKEYYHMVNYVKPLLLSTVKNFRVRFIDPITEGQCKDSDQGQIERMKKRVHVLHKILGGCVQRKDYSALTKFLPPKHEYVISVRMGTKQCSLYEKYLSNTGVDGVRKIHGRNARLFRDYQTLMKIWTHPWLLTLDNSKESKVNKQPIPVLAKYAASDQSPCNDDSDTLPGGIIPSLVTEIEAEPDGEGTPDATDSHRVNDEPPVLGPISDMLKTGDDADGNSDMIHPLDEIMSQQLDTERNTSSPRDSDSDKPLIIDINDEPSNLSWVSKSDERSPPTLTEEMVSDPAIDNEMLLADWWKELVTDEDENNMSLSGKIMLLVEILDMCRNSGDKLLVFSQSIPSLNLIEVFLRERSKLGNSDTDFKQSKNVWMKEKDYYRIDGTTSAQKRKDMQKAFNDPLNTRASLFLISTKAGSLGTNLVAANRVIIFDASWNPAHDIQSIFRVYRFGQVKQVFVYRFLAQGTMEEKIYERQVTKQSLSQRVIDEHQIERHFTSADLQALYEFKPDRLDDPDREEMPLPNLPKDELLASLMTNQKDLIVTFHEHDSLLENIEEQELTEEEKKAAWEDYERKALHIYKPVEPSQNADSNQSLEYGDGDVQQANGINQPPDQNLPLEWQNQSNNDVSQFGDWFDQPDTSQLFHSLIDLIGETCPEILMQGDAMDPVQSTSHDPTTGHVQDSYGSHVYQQQNDLSTVNTSNAVLNIQHGDDFYHNRSFQPIVEPSEQAYLQIPQMHNNPPNIDNQYLLTSNAAIGNSNIQESTPTSLTSGQLYQEDLSRNVSNSETVSGELMQQRPSKDSIQSVSIVGDYSNISTKSADSADGVASDVQTIPLNLSISRDSPVALNAAKDKPYKMRDLNTPDLVINDEQGRVHSSDPSSVPTNEDVVNRYDSSSPAVKSHFKPKQRMLERLLFESQNVPSSPLTLHDLAIDEDSSSPKEPEQILNLPIRDSPIADTLHVDTPSETAKPEVQEDMVVDMPLVQNVHEDRTNHLKEDSHEEIGTCSVSDTHVENIPMVQHPLKDKQILSIQDTNVDVDITNQSDHNSFLDSHHSSHESNTYQTPTDDTDIVSNRENELSTESQETDHEKPDVYNSSDDIQITADASSEPSKNFLPHGIPFTVLDMSILRQQTSSPSSSAISTPFSPVKTSDYDDISDNESD